MASVKPGKQTRRTSPKQGELVRQDLGDDGKGTQIPLLIREAARNSPRKPSLEVLRQASRKCRACDLWKHATQTVFGNRSAIAKVMMVGEQPGDREDLAGEPYVGPAGKLLQEAMLQAGIDRRDVYLSNVVKHFRWEASGRGKRRIHKKPRQSEIDACHPWFEAEMEAISPQVLVCLGATAAKALLGNKFSVTRDRGKVVPSPLPCVVLATVHPSSILRSPNSESRHAEMEGFVRDLRIVAQLLAPN